MRRTLSISFILALIVMVATIRPDASRYHQDIADFGEWLTLPPAATLGGVDDTDIIHSRIFVDVVGRVSFASLELSATDEFSVWVNGDQVANDFIPGQLLEGRIDISRILRRGRNIIAFKITGHRRETAAAFRARLTYRDISGFYQRSTDPSWLVTPRIVQTAPGLRSDDELSWAEEALDPSPWQTPEVITNYNKLDPPVRTGLPLFVDYTHLNGFWFWPGSSQTKVATLSKTVEAGINTEMQLGVAVNGSYRLIVNRYLVNELDADSASIQLQDISPFLHPGENTIKLVVTSREYPPKMAVAGFTHRSPGLLGDLSDPNIWVLDQAPTLYTPLVDKAPVFTNFSSAANWYLVRYEFIEWLKRLLILGCFALVVLMLYHWVYPATLVQSLSVMALISVAIFLGWMIVYLLQRVLAVDLGALIWGSSWITGVLFLFVLLVSPPALERVANVEEARW